MAGEDSRAVNSKPAEELSRKMNRLAEKQSAGGELKRLQANAHLLDEYFRKSFETSLAGPELDLVKNPYAIVALGGYGRQEQCVGSDVDLLLLFRKKVPRSADALIREVIYPLWDIGLEVGHATRSLGECVRMATADFDILTPLLDGRFICGMSNLYAELMARVRNTVVARKADAVVAWLVDRNRRRHQRYGDSSFLLEPNLKEGQGGLRDYHTMRWIAIIRSGIKTFRDLEYYGYFSHAEFNELFRSLSFIWHVRNHLHRLTGRKCDQLYFEYQVKLAEMLNYGKAAGREPVERFLGELHDRMAFLKQRHRLFLYEQGLSEKQRRRRKKAKETRIAGLGITGGMLTFHSSGDIVKNPELLVAIFEESARQRIPLSTEARRLVTEFLYLVDRPFREAVPVVAAFERILLMPAHRFNVLGDMLHTGLLGRLVPEFNAIVDRIQFDVYHLFPVGRHSLRTVQTIKSFGGKQETPAGPLCSALYKKMRRRKRLLWAALLHDIGKGLPAKGHAKRGAQMVDRLLTARGMPEADVAVVSFLVREHLLLVKTATRRDIQSEETAIGCARIIKSAERLKMLYLLSVADSIATGPKAWNDWNATLLRDLFFKVLNILEKGELTGRKAVNTFAKKKAGLLGAAVSEPVRKQYEALLPVMSPRYLLYTPVGDIIAHVRLYQRLGDAAFVWQVSRTPAGNSRTVTVCARDYPGFFSRMAGVLTLSNIDILGAQVFTWRNNIALDILKVTAPPDRIFEDEHWAGVEKKLASALNGSLDLAALLAKKISPAGISGNLSEKPCRIVVDNDSSAFFTLVEVYANDFPGLLYTVTDALFRCGLDVWVAKIATQVDQVVDVFYVRDFDGQKVDTPEQIAEIKSQIAKGLPG